MRTDQYALYRVDLNTAGKDLWKKTYDQLKSENRQIRIDFYRQIHIFKYSCRRSDNGYMGKNCRYKRRQ